MSNCPSFLITSCPVIARNPCRALACSRGFEHGRQRRSRLESLHPDDCTVRLGGSRQLVPSKLGRLVIVGNHLAARALRNGEEFLACLLPVPETGILLRHSMVGSLPNHH